MADLDACLAKVAERFGTPSYVYLTDAIETRIAEIEDTLGRWFSLSYAMKCNPNPGLLKWLASRIEYVDVSSIGEFRLARQAGWAPAQASFTGPGKRDAEIAEIAGEAQNVGFGSQIRSYVLQPYEMVKDLRSEHETGDVDGVLGGGVQPFMEAYLQWQRASVSS